MVDLAAGQNESIWWTHCWESSTCAVVHQAPVMYEPIADPFNRLSVHISHQRAPVTTVIAIANIAILIIVSSIMIYTFVAIVFCKKFFTVIQAPPLFPLFPEKLPHTIIVVNCDAILLQPIRVITSNKNDPIIMISIWSLLFPYL